MYNIVFYRYIHNVINTLIFMLIKVMASQKNKHETFLELLFQEVDEKLGQ